MYIQYILLENTDEKTFTCSRTNRNVTIELSNVSTNTSSLDCNLSLSNDSQHYYECYFNRSNIQIELTFGKYENNL